MIIMKQLKFLINTIFKKYINYYYLAYYNNCDAIPMVEAINKILSFTELNI